ncbi:hypothetical protein GS891_25970 [Rhodococcus hoagii]|nr:hypothetical protein [Prescottella equi]
MLDLAPYVQSWMDTLARQRPVFHSESDFQLALALVLADDVAQLRLEKKLSVSEPVGGRSRLSIDVLGELDGHRIALELKYPKKRLRTSVEGEVFDLPASVLRISIPRRSGATSNASNDYSWTRPSMPGPRSR